MASTTRATTLFGLLLLSACTTPSDVIERNGSPDMIYESAGDSGRFYLADQPIEHPWRWDRKTLYYIEGGRAFLFNDGYLKNTRPLNTDERDIYEAMLQSRSPKDDPSLQPKRW